MSDYRETIPDSELRVTPRVKRSAERVAGRSLTLRAKIRGVHADRLYFDEATPCLDCGMDLSDGRTHTPDDCFNCIEEQRADG